MAHSVHHAPSLIGVVDLDGLADPAKTQRAQRVELFLVGAVLGAQLGDAQRAHPAGASSAGSGAAGSAPPSVAPASVIPLTCSPAPCCVPPPSPSTWLTVRPRSCAISAGVRSPRRPAAVAFTRLIGFCVPRLLERTSWLAASSRARPTPPPASTPRTAAAG